VVTGGANGIGLACACLLAEGGANVWIFDLEAERPAEVAQRFGARGLIADVADRASLAAAFAQVEAPEIVVANAGTVFEHDLDSATAEQWERTLAVNLTGVFHTVQIAARLMKPRRRGSIVLMASTNAVCPGLIRTRLTTGFFGNPERMREYTRHIPLGRGGEPEEVAHAVAFLASDLAAFITGATLLVDGGQMAAKFGTWREPAAVFELERWRLR